MTLNHESRNPHTCMPLLTSPLGHVRALTNTKHPTDTRWQHRQHMIVLLPSSASALHSILTVKDIQPRHTDDRDNTQISHDPPFIHFTHLYTQPSHRHTITGYYYFFFIFLLLTHSINPGVTFFIYPAASRHIIKKHKEMSHSMI